MDQAGSGQQSMGGADSTLGIPGPRPSRPLLRPAGRLAPRTLSPEVASALLARTVDAQAGGTWLTSPALLLTPRPPSLMPPPLPHNTSPQSLVHPQVDSPTGATTPARTPPFTPPPHLSSISKVC